MNLARGSIVDDKYIILSSLGMGGYGVVYKAKHKELDREVALKLLHEHIALDDETLSRFDREAKALSLMRHSNLVLFYGYGVWQGCRYIAMELVSGESLQSVLNIERALPVKRSVKLMLQVCDALHCAHSNSIIHRDLKPSNIIYSVGSAGSDQVKVIDFGLAKLSDPLIELQALTQEGFIVGTVEYMSPEQCLAKPVDHRADIYSAGCILYRCVTGKAPFSAEDCATVLQQQVYDHPAPIDQFFSRERQPPAQLQAILCRCLAKSPEERYQSVKDMQADLESLLSDPGFNDVCVEKPGSAMSAGQSDGSMSLSNGRSYLAAGMVLVAIFVFFAILVVPPPTSRQERLGELLAGRSTSISYLQSEPSLVDGVDDFKVAPKQIDLCIKILRLDKVDHLLRGTQRFNLTYRLVQMLRAANRFDDALEWATPVLNDAFATRRFHHHFVHLCIDYSRCARHSTKQCDPSPLLWRAVRYYPKTEDLDGYVKLLAEYAGAMRETNPTKSLAILNNFIENEPTAMKFAEIRHQLAICRVICAQELMAAGNRKGCAIVMSKLIADSVKAPAKMDGKWERRAKRVQLWLDNSSE